MHAADSPGLDDDPPVPSSEDCTSDTERPYGTDVAQLYAVIRRLANEVRIRDGELAGVRAELAAARNAVDANGTARPAERETAAAKLPRSDRGTEDEWKLRLEELRAEVRARDEHIEWLERKLVEMGGERRISDTSSSSNEAARAKDLSPTLGIERGISDFSSADHEARRRKKLSEVGGESQKWNSDTSSNEYESARLKKPSVVRGVSDVSHTSSNGKGKADAAKARFHANPRRKKQDYRKYPSKDEKDLMSPSTDYRIYKKMSEKSLHNNLGNGHLSANGDENAGHSVESQEVADGEVQPGNMHHSVPGATAVSGPDSERESIHLPGPAPLTESSGYDPIALHGPTSLLRRSVATLSAWVVRHVEDSATEEEEDQLHYSVHPGVPRAERVRESVYDGVPVRSRALHPISEVSRSQKKKKKTPIAKLFKRFRRRKNSQPGSGAAS